MRHLASSRFWDLYRDLPEEVRQLADKNFELLKANPRHPALHFKRIGELWSVRSARIIERWAWTSRMEFTGSGLARMLTMTTSSARPSLELMPAKSGGLLTCGMRLRRSRATLHEFVRLMLHNDARADARKLARLSSRLEVIK